MANKVFMASCLYIFSMPWAINDAPQIYVTPLITGIEATKTSDMEKPSYVVRFPREHNYDFINARLWYKVSAYSPIVKERIPFSSFNGHFHKEYDPFDAYIISYNIGVDELDEYLNPLLSHVTQAPIVYTLPDFLRINPMYLDEGARHKIRYIAETEISILEGNHR